MINLNSVASLAKHWLGFANPIYVLYLVTYKCNLRCRMCNVYAQKSNGELSLVEVNKVADILKELGVGIVNIGGGEPLVRQDSAEIIRAFSKRGISTRLQTNAVLIDENKIKEMLDAGLEGISISLDTLNMEKESYIFNVKNVAENVIKNILLLANIFPYPQYSILTSVVSKYNIDDVEDVIKFADMLGWYHSIIPVHLDKSGKNKFCSFDEKMRFNRDDFKKIDEVYDKILAYKSKGYRIFNYRDFLEGSKEFLKNGKSNWSCSAGMSYFAIRPDGNISPCHHYNIDLNILDPKFKTILKSAEYKKRMKKLIPKCLGCMNVCWAEIENTLRIKGLLERGISTLRFTRKKEIEWDKIYQFLEEKGIK